MCRHRLSTEAAALTVCFLCLRAVSLPLSHCGAATVWGCPLWPGRQ